MLEVVLDPPRVAHAGGADDDLGIVVLQDHLGLLGRDRELESREGDGIDAVPEQGQGLLIIAGLLIGQEDLRRVDRQGAVDIDREVFVLRDQVVLLDLAQVIQDDLGPAHREGRDHHVAAPGEGIAQDLGQLLHRRRPVALVQAVAVGRFHDDIVRLLRIGRILEQGLVLVADIAGKDDLFLRPALGQPQLHAGGSQQVADVRKAEADALTEGIDLAVGIGGDETDQVHRVLHRIDGLEGFDPDAPLLLFVSPLRLHGLDVGGIAQHDVAQAGRRLRRDHLAAEAVLIEFGQHARVVDVGMCHDDEIDLVRGHRERGILKFVSSLPHAAVDQDILVSNLQIMTAPRHFMVGADKFQFHHSLPSRSGSPALRSSSKLNLKKVENSCRY